MPRGKKEQAPADHPQAPAYRLGSRAAAVSQLPHPCQPEPFETFPNSSRKAEPNQLSLRVTGVHDGDTITGLSVLHQQGWLALWAN